MRRWLLAGIAAIALAAGLFPAATTLAVRADAPAALSVDDCSTSQLADLIAIYTATPASRATPSQPTGSHLASVLRGRLQRCSAQLHVAACSPAAAENNVRVLWAQLKICAALADPPGTTAPANAPSIRWELPQRLGTGSRHVIFIIGAGGDAAMLGKLISTLDAYLVESGYYFANDSVLVAQPGWTPDLFAGLCVQSPQVEGAIVVQITAAGNGATDRLVSRRSWSAIEATALYAGCKRDKSDPSLPGVPTYIWASNVARAESNHITITPLTPLALLLTLGSAYEEFAPARTTTTQTTRVFATPAPIPSSGRVSQVQTVNTQVLNASSLSAVASGFLASSISYTNAAQPLTAPPTVDIQTWGTLQAVALALVKQMNCWLPPATALENERIEDVAGYTRELPAYNPPAGLGRYSQGEPSAPFCIEPGNLPPQELQLPTPQPAGGESIRDLLPSPVPT